MSYHTTDYFNAGHALIGGVIGGAVLVGNKPVVPSRLDPATIDAAFRLAVEEAALKQVGWRRPAWWYDARKESVDNPTHYAGYLPISLIKQKLFGWSAMESTKLIAHVELPDGTVVQVPVENHKAIIREDRLFEDIADPSRGWGNPNSVLSVMGKDYGTQNLSEVFIQLASEMLGGADQIGCTSAILLKWGRVACMEISVPQTLHNDKVGFGYRPNLLFYTSFDGSLKTSVARTITATVCDNTLQIAKSEAERAGASWTVPHTKNWRGMLPDGRQALGLIEQEADEFDQFLVKCAETPVTPKQFVSWLDEVLPVPEVKVIDGKAKTNSASIVINKRAAITKLYTEDERAATWTGTKLGVRQAYNTFVQHSEKVMGAKALGGNGELARFESNIMKSIQKDKNGQTQIEKRDEFAMMALDKVLELA